MQRYTRYTLGDTIMSYEHSVIGSKFRTHSLCGKFVDVDKVKVEDFDGKYLLNKIGKDLYEMDDPSTVSYRHVDEMVKDMVQIAPWVIPGSYICFMGEDHEVWKILFNNEKAYWVEGHIKYDEDHYEEELE